jgi:bacterioferritin-associated ferredoxin
VYVCNCNGIRERDVRAAIEQGAIRPRHVFDRHGCRPQCARCVCDVSRMIEDAAEALALAAE